MKSTKSTMSAAVHRREGEECAWFSNWKGREEAREWGFVTEFRSLKRTL